MSQYLITTTAAVDTCRRCGRLLLTGIAEGLRTRADITPCDDEAGALQAGRWTYNLHAGGLAPRYDWNRTRPARGPVLADHACPRPAPSTLF